MKTIYDPFIIVVCIFPFGVCPFTFGVVLFLFLLLHTYLRVNHTRPHLGLKCHGLFWHNLRLFCGPMSFHLRTPIGVILKLYASFTGVLLLQNTWRKLQHAEIIRMVVSLLVMPYFVMVFYPVFVALQPYSRCAF